MESNMKYQVLQRQEHHLQMTELQYASLLMHQLWESECAARAAGCLQCAGIVGLARHELLTLFPDMLQDNKRLAQ